MQALDSSQDVEYTFFGDSSAIEGIKPADTRAVKRFREVSYRKWRQFFWQPSAINVAICENWDAIIFLGNPNFVSTWFAACAAQFRRTPVLFWEHGWRRKERALKSAFRLNFFRLADRMLVYAPRAKQLGIAAGYPASRIDVVWNSLDTQLADQLIPQLEAGTLVSVQPTLFFSILVSHCLFVPHA